MAYRAKAIVNVDHPVQHKVQHKALKVLKRSKLAQRIDDLAGDMTAQVARDMCIDTRAAKKQARRWIVEVLAEAICLGEYEILFIE